MAQEGGEANLVKPPEMGAFRYLGEEPADEEGVEGDQEKGMGEVPVVLDGELAIDEAEEEVGIWENPCGHPGKDSPSSNLLILDGFGDDRSR